jgi:hypothetical protein
VLAAVLADARPRREHRAIRSPQRLRGRSRVARGRPRGGADQLDRRPLGSVQRSECGQRIAVRQRHQRGRPGDRCRGDPAPHRLLHEPTRPRGVDRGEGVRPLDEQEAGGGAAVVERHQHVGDRGPLRRRAAVGEDRDHLGTACRRAARTHRRDDGRRHRAVDEDAFHGELVERDADAVAAAEHVGEAVERTSVGTERQQLGATARVRADDGETGRDLVVEGTECVEQLDQVGRTIGRGDQLDGTFGAEPACDEHVDVVDLDRDDAPVPPGEELELRDLGGGVTHASDRHHPRRIVHPGGGPCGQLRDGGEGCGVGPLHVDDDQGGRRSGCRTGRSSRVAEHRLPSRSGRARSRSIRAQGDHLRDVGQRRSDAVRAPVSRASGGDHHHDRCGGGRVGRDAVERSRHPLAHLVEDAPSRRCSHDRTLLGPVSSAPGISRWISPWISPWRRGRPPRTRAATVAPCPST